MNLKPIKISLTVIFGSVFMMSAVQVYADATGVDLFALAQSKVNSIIDIETIKSGTDLDNERQSVENQIYAYVDSYIQGIQSELDTYTLKQENTAKISLNVNYNDIKNQLDNQRQELITNAEQQISQTINTQLQNEQIQMNNDLNNGLTKKFK